MKTKIVTYGILFFCNLIPLQAKDYDYPFQNPSLPVEERVEDLISRLTLSGEGTDDEAPVTCRRTSGVPAYNWWNEALHGVARTSEKVTVFPQAIGMAATFDTEALEKAAGMISKKGALFNEDVREGKTGTIYRGLTYWTPMLTSSGTPVGDVDRRPMVKTRI